MAFGIVLLVCLLLLDGSWAALAADVNSSAQPLPTDTVTEHIVLTSTLPVSGTGPSPLEVTGDKCTGDNDCGESLFCDEGRCVCRDLTAILTSEKTCVPARGLGEDCHLDIQCQAEAGDAAVCTHGTCSCHHGLTLLHDSNGTSCVAGKDGEATPPLVPKPHIDPNMIIIMVVLGVMFVGMCLALHLFSRSRFRNNRTIFNSPHPRLMHIKLGKKQKAHRRTSHTSLHIPVSRQPSICSQRSHISPTGSRRGSPAGSQENLKGLPAANTLNGQLGAPIAKLDETSPTTEDVKKDIWKGAGPDVVKEASVVQNGPNSPTIIVTHTSGSRSPSGADVPSPIARV